MQPRRRFQEPHPPKVIALAATRQRTDILLAVLTAVSTLLLLGYSLLQSF